MPRYALLRIATLIGMPSERAVVNSWAVIWKQPSPSMHQTVRSGRPTFAPMAAGTPKPIVPAPPELIQVPGSSNFQCWRGPHLVLANAGRDDRARRGLGGDRFDDVLGTQRSLGSTVRRRPAGNGLASH